MEEKFADMKTKVQFKMDEFKQIMEPLEADVAILKKVVLQVCHSSNADVNPKVQVPEPKGFSGNRNTKELENFQWDMEQFLKAARVPKIEKVSITSMYLMSDAKVW